MLLEDLINLYSEAIFDTDRDRALSIVRDAERKGVSPEEIVFKVVLPAMDAMMKSVSEDSLANLAQHFITAQIADSVTAEMIPKFKQAPVATGRVVIGTAAGDMHTLGKRMVIGCLRAHLLDVKDLGINVRAEQFVDEAVAYQASVIAISAMMVHTARGENGCLRVRKILQDRGLEASIRIIVGGAPFRFDPELYKIVRADACGDDAIIGAELFAVLV